MDPLSRINISRDGIQIISGENQLDNYEHWSVDIKGLMTVKGLEEYLEPPVTNVKTEDTPAPPNTGDEEQSTQSTPTPQTAAQSRKDNASCLALIRRHVTGKLKTEILSCSQAHDAWTRIQAVFYDGKVGTVTILLQQLMSIRQNEGENVSAYIHRFERLVTRLDANKYTMAMAHAVLLTMGASDRFATQKELLIGQTGALTVSAVNTFSRRPNNSTGVHLLPLVWLISPERLNYPPVPNVLIAKILASKSTNAATPVPPAINCIPS